MRGAGLQAEARYHGPRTPEEITPARACIKTVADPYLPDRQRLQHRGHRPGNDEAQPEPAPLQRFG
ncbi:MAG: hypothetical protein MZU91_03015 [Desulfosudis oleivorans]|nr:hypothetical protein [Desulfosudis oleivorans]